LDVTAPISTTIDRCRVCDSASIAPVLDLGRQPLANSLRADRSEQLPTFPLIICRCDACGTIQLTETVRPDILFKHYVWVTGTSEGARKYSREFFERMTARSRPGQLFAVEVASNDGTFLKPFVERGDRVLGVDPAQNIAEMANKAGVPTLAEFFGVDVAKQIVARDGEADVVFGRNVLPHVPDPNDVVGGMARCLRADGTGAIEFHRADVILDELHYDSIYHEHLFYHSLHSINRLLDRFGLIAFDVTTSPISGGSFVVYFAKSPRPKSAEYEAMLKHERDLGIGDAQPWREFAARCERHRRALKEIVECKRREGKRVIGYGASARSSTLLNYCGIDCRHLEVVADKAPLKHDRFTPGTDIPIVSPERAFETDPDAVLLLAWNFRDEIIREIREQRGWSGEVIVPLPRDPQVVTI
jgi:SAM-dependent methyltransferase